MKFLGISVLSFFILIPFTAQAKVLISTVAQVQNNVITSREVNIHKHLNEALGERFEAAEVADLDEQVIHEWLLFFEASSFYNSPITASEISEVVKQAQLKLNDDKSWKALDVPQKELRDKIKRRLEADRLFIFKKKASVLPVSAAEIETEYRQNRVRYGNLEFEEVKEKIRQNKVQENLKNRLEQWFQVLARKYKVQRFAKYRVSQ